MSPSCEGLTFRVSYDAHTIMSGKGRAGIIETAGD